MRTNMMGFAGALALTLSAATGIAQSADSRTTGSLAETLSKPYLGMSIGRADFEDAPCVAPYSCDDHHTALKIFAGTMFSRYFGAELSYVDFGEVGRNGGDTKAYGFNLGLVGVAPLTSQLSLLGKVGTIYSRTRTSSATPLIATGKDNGFGVSYGVGARYDVTRNWSLRADWDRYRAQFPGRDDYISMYSAGLAYSF